MNDDIHLRNLDLNLLVVFDAIFRERHVTRAANQLGMSQPAVSNALQRLRDTLQDDLLVKTPTGMAATDRALELAGPIRNILEEVEGLLANRCFDPATAADIITIATVDYFNIAILPDLAKVLTKQAPNLTLRVVPSSGRSIELLDNREVDLAFASYGTIPKRFAKKTLRRESYMCVLRENHPILDQGLTPETYAALKHIMHSPGGDLRGTTDAALAELGLSRHISLTVSSFLHAGEILRSTDMIMTAPKSVANKLARQPKLTQTNCPVEAGSAEQHLDILWHRNFGERPANKWLRAIIEQLVQGTSETSSH